MSDLRTKILDAIVKKSTLKQQIFDNTFSTFNDLKEVLFEMASEIDDELDGKLDRRSSRLNPMRDVPGSPPRNSS